MNRIDERFASLRKAKKAAFIPYLTIGDPSVDISFEIIKELVAAGADCIELGVPYSDPLADGPIIQRAAQRALENEINIPVVLSLAKRCREAGITIPLILFTYYNPILQMGIENAMELFLAHQIDGLIIPDLPVEECEEVRDAAQARGLHIIPLVAPTSNDRVAKIVSSASGFVYCVSSLGVTGTRTSFFEGIDSFLDFVRQSTDLPICVGFGISNHDQYKYFSTRCDGIIVGSAIVRTVEEALELLKSDSDREQGLAHVRQFLTQLVHA